MRQFNEHPEGSTPLERPDLLVGQHFPPPPKQARSRGKRDALLQSALTLFAEYGYEETSIEGIAHHADVAVGGFYQHFASKRQVLLVLMNRLLEEASMLTQHVGNADISNIRGAIESLVRQGLQVDWSYAGAYRAWREAVVQERELRELHLHIEQWTAQQIEFMVRLLLQAPEARPSVDIATFASVLSILFWRLAEVPLKEPDMVIASVTELIYHALFTN